MSKDIFKHRAAEAALDLVEPGMRLGLGTGTTAAYFIELLGERVRDGLDVIAVPTSEAAALQAEEVGIPLTTLDETPILDLTVDGADEVGPDLALIKGGGGALLLEKIVACASGRVVVIADHSKWVGVLGRFPLPIEVVPFGLKATQRAITACVDGLGLAAPLSIRRAADGHVFVTDAGHVILDAAFGRIPAPAEVAAALSQIPGVVEHGLFLGMADLAIVAGPTGVVRIEREANHGE